MAGHGWDEAHVVIDLAAITVVYVTFGVANDRGAERTLVVVVELRGIQPRHLASSLDRRLGAVDLSARCAGDILAVVAGELVDDVTAVALTPLADGGEPC